MTALPILAAHLLADFVLQSDAEATGKFDDWTLRTTHCAKHWVVLGIAASLTTHIQPAIVFATVAAVTHWVIDTRRWADPKPRFETYPIWVDQTLHITALAVCQVLLL